VEKLKIAEEFLKQTATFKFDGIEGSIELIKAEDGVTSAFPSRIFTFTFQTRHPGHGDRTGQILAQVITNHTAIITVDIANDIVKEAICDNEWDMLAEKVYPHVVPEAVQNMALDFIKNSATFKFDGIADSLKIEGTEDIAEIYDSMPKYRITVDFQTSHPGYGNRTGQMLAQVITNHTAVITIISGKITLAICDGEWDMLAEKLLPTRVSGIVISGGDTTPSDGPTDAPRIFTYQIKQADNTLVNVSYTAYPPSPVGETQQKKFVLSFRGGSVQIGDQMNAQGTYDKASNTVVVSEEGDYIFTMTTDETARQIAVDFMNNNNTTFNYDGIPDSLKLIKTEPGFTSAYRSTAFTFTYQTHHPGHGDRSGQVLAEVITDHTALVLVNIENGQVAFAVCDGEWDILHNKELPTSIYGYIISGGDTFPADGPLDAPHKFIYTVKKDDSSLINVSYMGYPPSPVGDAYKARVTLEFWTGSIEIGDRIEALGMFDKETNTVVIANEGDFIRTYEPKIEVVGMVISGGDTTPADSPQDAPRIFVYKIQKDNDKTMNVTYTVFPPSPTDESAVDEITLSYYDGEPKAGDYMKPYGTYDVNTETITVAE
jgi:hypothetical protein